MVSSLDGLIARKDNSVSWFETSSHYEKGVVGEDLEAFLKTIDCYVMGSKTYELALELSKEHGWVYGEKPVKVVTKRNFVTDRQKIEFYTGDLHKLVNEKLKPNYQNVWVAGGSMLTRNFIQQKLAERNKGKYFADHFGRRVAFLRPHRARAGAKIKRHKSL